MDFRELVYITTVADCKSVTGAARKLYISQPSLSQIISKVEADLGVSLFDRTTYPIVLTYAGERYVETAKKILLIRDNLRRELIDIGNGSKGRLKLGIPRERAGYMLPAALSEFRKVYPGVELSTMEAKSSLLLEELRKGEIDLLILPADAVQYGGDLRQELIYQEELLLVAGPSVVVPELCIKGMEQAVDVSKLEGLPFILLETGHAIRSKVDQIFEQFQISPHIVMETSGTINAVQFAGFGHGVTIVPKRAVDVLGNNGEFCCYSLGEQPLTWDINAVCLKDSYLDGAERYFIEVMKKLMTAGGRG